MNQQTLKQLNKYLEHMLYYNRMSPFPLFDTGDIIKLKFKIRNIKMSKIDYDELPVAACKYCNNLHLMPDEVENDVCMRCGAVNDIVIYPNIHEYLKIVEEDEEHEAG